MKTLLITLLLVGFTLAFVKNRGMRDDFNSKAVEFLSGRDGEAARAEMTPSPGCVEGDMELTSEQKDVYFAMREATAKNRARVRRDAQAAFSIWPNKTLVYRFDASLDNGIKQVFREAIEIYREHTGLSFEEAFDDYSGAIHPLVVYGLNDGCSSSVGYRERSGGRMHLETEKCGALGTILHELGHALGRFHEQTRSDRDDYITVIESNILPGFEHNFRKADRPILALYDLQSIMHYSRDAFSFDRRSSTIMPHNAKDSEKMGTQRRLSRLDVFTVNAAYGVDALCPADLWDKCQRGGVPNKHCSCDCLPEFEGPYCEIVVIQTECSGHYQLEESGLISSPGYPNTYSSNAKCSYVIECAKDEVVQLDFLEFSLEGWGCFFDKMNMMTGDLVTEEYPDEYCDDNLKGESVFSKSNVALMTFESDDMFNYEGYQIFYHCIHSDLVSK
ncbi:blastula protease 10-like isoform X1 [Asterias rubens]|uniref:blastula protease 10-like isoform X1 n=2 Tax=Asterias rubens TaxID=7604 RepID=UPI0014553229|nr:blastula protease 10-like isoform X1 [Asterias rubens]UVH36234.1 sea star footprint protein astacin-like [Asterias rubens]